ncbi:MULTISPECIES: ion transporter [unclassified Microbispora]|uniref:ion transporter n=1 Tax=unclassified Microbispora TaxID=2614687 RepID=UPI00197B1C15|nr:ion transporter [Microbispora sp. SCL1-1]
MGLPFQRERLRVFIDSPVFQRAVIAVIALNGLSLGLETSHELADRYATAFLVIDRAILAVFVVEIILRIAVHGKAFFRDPWNWFDLVIVGMALVPASESVSILRLFRFLRVLRLISVVPGMRRVVSALFAALPGLASAVVLLLLSLYTASVIGEQLFHEVAPRYFGDLGRSLFTMFTVLTVEGWPEVAEDVMTKEPLAWIFFATFIVITAFFVLNLLIGVIVSAMEAEVNAQRWKDDQELELQQHIAVMNEIRALNEKVDRLAAQLPALADAAARDRRSCDHQPSHGEAPQAEGGRTEGAQTKGAQTKGAQAEADGRRQGE